MKKNLGSADRIVRLLIAAVIAVLYFSNIITGTLGVILLVVAIVLTLTTVISFCPLYAVLGISTCAVKK